MENKEPVDAFIEVAEGAQNIGKTTETFTQALNKAFIDPYPLKVLFFETNIGEYAQKKDKYGQLHKIKPIKPENISTYGDYGGRDVRRISPLNSDGSPMSPDDTMKLLHRVCREYKDGILVVEDFTILTGDTIDKITAGLLCNVRHRGSKGVYLKLHIQGAGAIVPKVRRNTAIIRHHYCSESISQVANKLRDEAELFYIVEKLVNKQYHLGNKYFFVYVYRMHKKIVGSFSNAMLTTAIQEYLLENPREFKNLLNRTDLEGHKLYSYQQALNIKIVELYKKYQGNYLNLKPN